MTLYHNTTAFYNQSDISIVNRDDSSEFPGVVRIPREAEPREYLAEKKPRVSGESRYVSCERFRPIPRGKYLISPSLSALHACYKHGLSLAELKGGIERSDDSGLRYDLENLFVACDVAFEAESMDELTRELGEDYQRCKRAGALDAKSQTEIEQRFAEILATVGW